MFWRGDFGDSYSKRKVGDDLVADSIALFTRVFSRTKDIKSVMEFGANIGLNMVAIRALIPDAELSAVEINKNAVEELKKLGGIKTYSCSMLDFDLSYLYDLVFTRGVLIHINPLLLNDAYDVLYNSSKRYILIAEYYNPTPVSLEYRGFSDRLFKRDFAGEMLDRYPDMVLLDYGFVYHRDNMFPQDDITWFLFEKHGGDYD